MPGPVGKLEHSEAPSFGPWGGRWEAKQLGNWEREGRERGGKEGTRSGKGEKRGRRGRCMSPTLCCQKLIDAAFCYCVTNGS